MNVEPVKLVWLKPSQRDAIESTPGTAFCHGCGRRLGFWTRRAGKLTLADDDESGREEIEIVPLGGRAQLEPGFVRARTRHASENLRWYVRGPKPERPSPPLRLPAVVTCACGRDNLCESLGDPEWSEVSGDEAIDKALQEAHPDPDLDDSSSWRDY